MEIRDAVSACFVYEAEVFVIVRQAYLNAFPGYHAFPGGKLDRDEECTTWSSPLLAGQDPQLMHALVREMKEELGFDLEQACSSGQITAIAPLCTATTPAFEQYRFRNRFFRIDLAERPRFAVDEQETAEYGWFRPAELIALWNDGRMLTVPPLRVMLVALAQDINRTQIEGLEFSYDAQTEVPVLEILPKLWIVPVLSNTLPPAERTNCLVVGGYLVDPSPADEAELQRLICTLDQYQAPFALRGIFLTHHHVDHYQFVNQLARHQDLPLILSEDTHTRILGHEGNSYFHGIKLRHAKDGDTLTSWHGQSVRVYAVPGHDEGQLALAPDDLKWFLVGDLIQGVGTVVIAEPEGHMGRYFQSLEKVIRLDPKCIIPSHGITMGGTYRLKATLKHRRQREQQVLQFYGEGKRDRALLECIYKGLDPRLEPFAMANIKAHLSKLHQEGLLNHT